MLTCKPTLGLPQTMHTVCTWYNNLWLWPLTFWHQGQYMPKACHELNLQWLVSGVHSSSSFLSRALMHTDRQTKSQSNWSSHPRHGYHWCGKDSSDNEHQQSDSQWSPVPDPFGKSNGHLAVNTPCRKWKWIQVRFTKSESIFRFVHQMDSFSEYETRFDTYTQFQLIAPK